MDKYHKPVACNLLNQYFPLDSAICRVVAKIQQGFVKGVKFRFHQKEEILPARDEVTRQKYLMDSSYILAQDLAETVLGKDVHRTVLTVKGRFLHQDDSKSVDSVFSIDLGTNPHQLYRTSTKGSVDDEVSQDQTASFLANYAAELIDLKFYEFDLAASRFFYFKEQDIREKSWRDGAPDLEKITRMVCGIPKKPKTHLLLSEVESPNIEEYLASGCNFVSWRLKRTLGPKIVRLADMQRDNYPGIMDWVAFRMLFDNENGVRSFGSFLAENPAIGRTKITYLNERDYLKTPKDRGYAAVHIVAKASVLGDPEYVVEFHLVPRAQYYINEINPFSLARHAEYEKLRRHANKQDGRFHQYYLDVLSKIFGGEVDPICLCLKE